MQFCSGVFNFAAPCIVLGQTPVYTVSGFSPICHFAPELNLVCWWKNVLRVSSKQHGGWSQVSCKPETQSSCKLSVLVHCLAQTCETQTVPTNT